MTKARIQEFVIADLIRNPECAWHWMPDRVRHDKPILALREHLRHRHWMPDVETPNLIRVRHDKVNRIVFGAHTFPGNRPASWATLAA